MSSVDRPSFSPPRFSERSRRDQVITAGVVPAVIGALAGVMLGVSSGVYWAVAALAAVGGFLAGFEHPEGWDGAKRGLSGGAIYGLALLLAHAIAGTHAKVSLGSFPPLLILVTAIIGTLLSGASGRIAGRPRGI